MSIPNPLKTNSANPSSAMPVAGAYNTVPPAPEDGQTVALQTDSEGNLLVKVAGSGATTAVNITEVGGNPEGITNPLPVELSDGANPVGTPGNPLSVNIITGGANPSVGTTGTPAPTSATEIGVIDGSGNLQGASSSNPVPVTGAVTVTGSVTATVSGTVATKDAADATIGSVAPNTVTQVGLQNSLGQSVAAQADATGNLAVAFTGPNQTILQEMLMELRAVRRLLMLVYEESGEGNPAALLDDSIDPIQEDYN
jgi:hypothetical protein